MWWDFVLNAKKVLQKRAECPLRWSRPRTVLLYFGGVDGFYSTENCFNSRRFQKPSKSCWMSFSFIAHKEFVFHGMYRVNAEFDANFSERPWKIISSVLVPLWIGISSLLYDNAPAAHAAAIITKSFSPEERFQHSIANMTIWHFRSGLQW